MLRVTSLSCLMVSACLVLLSPACSDDGGNGSGSDGQVATADGGADGSTPSTTLAGTAVVNSITLPQSATDYALDVDGDGSPDNHLGAMLGAVSSLFDAQAYIDEMITNGELIMMFQIFADSLTDEPGAKVQARLGLDSDGDATDNFSGSEEFDVDSSGPSDAILNGTISSGRIEVGPGKLLVPIPFGAQPITVSVVKGQLRANVADATDMMTSGQLNGAVPMSDVDAKIIPAIAATLTAELTVTEPDPIIVDMDTDDDGTITAAELKDNALIGAVLAPDVDTDGDGTKDAISIGMGFTGVKAVLKGI